MPKSELPIGVRYAQILSGDYEALGRLLDDCDEIVDLAHATVPKTSFDDPIRDLTLNLPFNVKLLELASLRKLRRIVFVSSGGTVYGDANYLPIDESHPTNPISPYGITKLAIEKYGLMYWRTRQLPIVIVRPSNPYGPGQYPNLGQGFIAAAIHNVIREQPITVFGERGAVRDYIYIDDLAAGIAAALDFGTPGSIYNIGSGSGLSNISVIEKIDLLAGASGSPRATIRIEPPRSFDVAQNVLSVKKMAEELNWKPMMGIDEGLDRTWSWMRRLVQD